MFPKMTAASPQSVDHAANQPQALAVRGFSPEFNLLLACCADLSDQDRAARLQELLSGALDWDGLLTLAEYHGVLPQLYRRLSATEAASHRGFAAIRQRYEASVRQSMWLTGELMRVLDHLESRDIQALSHKGPVLAEILYGNVAMRQFSDLDFLVNAADVPSAKAALLELGYEPSLKLTPREERAYLASGYEYTFDSPHGRNLLEIQWQILPRFYSIDFDMDGIFERTVVTNFAGRSVRTLSVEDALLILCVHAAKHAWVQLSWLCDIAELVRSRPVDWKIVQSEAARLGIERIVSANFFLTNKLLGILPPRTVRIDVETESLAKSIFPIITNSTEYDAESISYFSLMAQLRERRSDRTRFFWRLISTPSVGDWSAVRLPAALFPLYRAVRLFRVMSRL